MRSWMIAFITAVVLAGFVPQLPPLPVVCLIALAALLSLWRPGWPWLAGLLAGLAWFLAWACWLEARLWPGQGADGDIHIEGVVWSLPRVLPTGQRFVFRMEAMCRPDLASHCNPQPLQPRLVRLTDYAPDGELAPGQRRRWTVRLRRPHGMANPGTFDYETWLLQQGVTATGYVRPQGVRVSSGMSTRPVFERLRWQLEQWWRRHADLPMEYPHLLQALSYGQRGGLSDAEWTRFSRYGLNHLMVISGLHIGLVCWLVYRALLSWRFVAGHLLLRIPAPRFAAVGAMLAAFVYAGLAGFSLPATRALVMAVVVLSSMLLARQSAAVNALLLAAVLVLLIDPLAPQGAGFWLSFTAVALLLHCAARAPPAQGRLAHYRRLFVIQLVLGLGMLPVMAVFFQHSALAGPLVNMLAIPLVGILVVPLALTGTCLLLLSDNAAIYSLLMADQLLQACFSALDWLDASAGVEGIALPPLLPVELAVLILLIILLLAWQRSSGRALCAILIAGLLVRPRAGIDEDELLLHVLDVGQGLAVVIQARDYVLVYDAGPRFASGFDTGREIVLPVLQRLGVEQVDTVVISHADADHAGGLPALAGAMPSSRYYAPTPALLDAAPGADRCRGQQWRAGGAQWRFLESGLIADNRNNGSCVLQVIAGDLSILLPGDIEKRIEYALLKRYPALQADILLAPHHGSKTSSSWALVKSLRAGHVVFSAGYHNAFGHPAAAIVDRYRQLDAAVYTTAQTGMLSFRLSLDAGTVEPQAWRVRKRRFWYTQDVTLSGFQ